MTIWWLSLLFFGSVRVYLLLWAACFLLEGRYLINAERARHSSIRAGLNPSVGAFRKANFPRKQAWWPQKKIAITTSLMLAAMWTGIESVRESQSLIALNEGETLFLLSFGLALGLAAWLGKQLFFGKKNNPL